MGETGAQLGGDQQAPQASSIGQIEQESAQPVDAVASRTNQVPRMPSVERQMPDIRKRDFIEMHNGDAHYEIATELVDAMSPGFWKKPRIDDARTDIVNGGSDTAGSQIMANEGKPTIRQQEDSPAGQSKGFETDGITLVKDSSRIDAGTESSVKVSQVEDSDSDSPIPEIDASFTTDDEDEVDEQTMDVE